jgi:hypothetical protein
MRRPSPTQERVLRWLASGGTYDDWWGHVRSVPAIGGPPAYQRTVESLCRAGWAAWETRPKATGVTTYRVLRITAEGRAALAQVDA